MAPDGPDRIQHVSDTALMVAACRAIETARADGLVRDPFAEMLAGPRGDAILRGITGWQLMCFGIGVRTRFLDDLVVETIARENIEVVLSVGAGLDTRPWRLELPPELRWIEADFRPVYPAAVATLSTNPPSAWRTASSLSGPTPGDPLLQRYPRRMLLPRSRPLEKAPVTIGLSSQCRPGGQAAGPEVEVV